jgi:hypothetical protein
MDLDLRRAGIDRAPDDGRAASDPLFLGHARRLGQLIDERFLLRLHLVALARFGGRLSASATAISFRMSFADGSSSSRFVPIRFLLQMPAGRGIIHSTSRAEVSSRI